MEDPATPTLNRAERAHEHGLAWVGRFVGQIRPRVSLASGSLFVLLTLFLPIGFEACGPARRGHELMNGKGDWPTLMGLASSVAGRDFYALVLLVAFFTLIMVTASAVRPDLIHNSALIPRMTLLTGAISLFLVCDVTLLLAALSGDKAGPAALLPVVLSCLAPGIFWPRKGFAAWISVLVISGTSLLIVDRLGLQIAEPINWIVITLETIYALIPLGLWFRYGLSSRPEVRARWKTVQRGLVALYFFAVLGNIWFLGIAISEDLWGFVPCYLGIHLMSLGYWRLGVIPSRPL
ncbi:MAG: hypothetical protein ACE145_06620 [Terriglobia bacterium]